MKEFVVKLAPLCALFLSAATTFGQPTTTPGSAIPSIRLNNGVEMPALGFGTLDLKGPEGVASVAHAIRLGYRLLDTATIYGNEDTVGAAIKQSGVDRRDLFISTKLWVSDMGYEGTKKAFARSLQLLGTDYIDLYLIHRPRGDVPGSWKAMEELCKAGKIRAIGVSNFDPTQLAALIAHAEIKPVINQIEMSPYFPQTELQKSIEQMGVKVESWSPFAEGRNGFFTNEVLRKISQKHRKSVAQVTLRWLIQRGVVAIPRSSKTTHMAENLQVFDFTLDREDLEQISTLDRALTQFPEWN